jgi:hypothetical protein
MKYWLKIKEFRYLVISWGRDDNDSNYFKAWKFKGRPFFARYTKVIDMCVRGRRLVLEF